MVSLIKENGLEGDVIYGGPSMFVEGDDLSRVCCSQLGATQDRERKQCTTMHTTMPAIVPAIQYDQTVSPPVP